jgi:antitoxin CptB
VRPEVQKLLWRSRRGMLELDMLFRNYLTTAGDNLSEQQLQEFEQLLSCQDQELFDAYSGKQPLPDKPMNELFSQIIGNSH